MNLSYFIVIVNAEKEKNIQAIILTCMPNGNLSQYYDKDFEVSYENPKKSLLAPGKNYTDARYRYYDYRFFELLGDDILRLKILYWNENVYDDILDRFPEHEEFIKKYWNDEYDDNNLKKRINDIKEEFFEQYTVNKEIFLKIRNLKDIHEGLSHLKEIYDKQEETEKNKSILYK